MLAQVLSGAVLGVDAYTVHVEVDIAQGLPQFMVVGLPESAVREGRERVTAALHNTGFDLPQRRITVNLAPADIRKEGSAFDLPIALGLLAAHGAIPGAALGGVCCVGELGLDGELRPVRGALSLALRCREEGIRHLIVPAANAAEAAVVADVEVQAAELLGDVARQLLGGPPLPRVTTDCAHLFTQPTLAPAFDFADVRGQEHAKRSLEVAAAGGHNVLMIGPPGAGKSMLARRLPGVLPPLTVAEAVEVTRVHSVAGRLRAGQALVTMRPFRAPHHSISEAGLIGGGPVPRPGEASLAHHGVLFLDELPEFHRRALESLRQPLEEGHIHLGRARAALVFPARVMLIAAMNPCPCGFHGDGEARCICGAGEVKRYIGRVSGPLMDRIDVHIHVPALPARRLQERAAGEPTAVIRERVAAARVRQLARFRGRPDVFCNAQMTTRDVRELCRTTPEGDALLRTAIQRLALSARAYHRILKLALTIADLAGETSIGPAQIAEAVQYRSLDRRLLTGSPVA